MIAKEETLYSQCVGVGRAVELTHIASRFGSRFVVWELVHREKRGVLHYRRNVHARREDADAAFSLLARTLTEKHT